MSPSPVFSSDLTLPYSAINATGRIKADWLLNAFQDAASVQCHQFGVSGFDMAPKGLKWVVSQYDIRIHSHLPWLSGLRLRTWRAPWKNLYEVRQFSITAGGEKPFASATGIWILIRSGSGKPVRLSPHLPDAMMQNPADPPELNRISSPLGICHHEIPIQAGFLDLDLNQHVNNCVYLRWAINSLPEPYCFEFAPVRCRVAYLREGFLEDRLVSRIRLSFSGDRLSTRHAIVNSAREQELARIDIDWDRLPPSKGSVSHGN